MTDAAMMPHLPRYVPAQREAAQATAERRARMTLPQTLPPPPEPPPFPAAGLHLRPGKRSEPPKVHEVQRAVCVYLGTRLENMLGTSQKASDVRPRQLAMYLAVRLTSCSECEIGRRFGGRDPTTVRHGCRQVEAALRNDPLYVRAVQEIREILV